MMMMGYGHYRVHLLDGKEPHVEFDESQPGDVCYGELKFTPEAADFLRATMAGSTCPRCADLSADALEVARLRETFGGPPLTPEETEVALLERELEQARVDGVIARWEPTSCKNGNWYYMVAKPGEIMEALDDAATRLDAARAAAKYVREQRKLVLKPEEMYPDAIVVEMMAMGYRLELRHQVRSCGVMRWVDANGDPWQDQSDCETPLEFHREALTGAREKEATNANR